jgi:hypothetical protein
LDALSVSVQPRLTAYRGKLLSGRPDVGTAVHAARFIRQRRIVLEADLFADAQLLRLIFVHEHFHFVWPRLSNSIRREFASLLERERDSRARGELGESSAVRKLTFTKLGTRWQDYVCESFCDTAAWFYSELERHHTFTLGKRWRERRRRWFCDRFERYCRLRCS